MAEESASGGVVKRKLIEVALPLEAINRASAREKSIRHGHPSTLHLWWARRPLAAARAVLFAQLVDDPSSHPDRFPTEAHQRAERERLHRMIEELVKWENTRNQELLDAAHQEILNSTGGNPPPILDPFAGGGTIPLEAQRLGLEAHASDLNPVAVLINKALIEIPPKFAGRQPVFPGLAAERMDWEGAAGLAADVRAYGEWMRNEAAKRIGHHYPKAKLPDGTQATVIAWIWARTVTCPNPACGIEMPLLRSWWLAKKRNKAVWIRPEIVADSTHASGRRVQFVVVNATTGQPSTEATVGRTGATCIACGAAASLDHVRAEGRAGRMGARLIALVAAGNRTRLYIQAERSDEAAADIASDAEAPEGLLSTHPQYMGAPRYGLTHTNRLFTPRQLSTMLTFTDFIPEARDRVRLDAQRQGADTAPTTAAGGIGAAEAYADAVATYLALGIGRLANRGSSLCIWNTVGEKVEQTFARNALPLIWAFAEANPFSSSTGNMLDQLAFTANALEAVPAAGIAEVEHSPAQTSSFSGRLLSTDPPYYDNVPYADLSDFFYVWLRRALQPTYPDLFATLLVPKAEELVANTVRHGGVDGARAFFEQGFKRVFEAARSEALEDYPITVYYAFRQADETGDGRASTGWETLLEGMIQAGWTITATWPVRTERAGGLRELGRNALASSVVLALRPRQTAAPTIDRRGFIAALHDGLPEALRKLQQGTIAPVDLPQAAIGPGMAVFSRYSRVIENDGSTMTVRSALARINEILDQVLNEQEGDFDTATRFAIAWYRQYGYKADAFGAADNIARGRNTSVDAMVREGILSSAAGRVKLFSPAELPEDYDVLADDRVGVWEALHHLIAALDRGGLPQAGTFMRDLAARPGGEVDAELVKELAFLLFATAEKNRSTQDALAFNSIATAWPEIMEAARGAAPTGSGQSSFDFEEEA